MKYTAKKGWEKKILLYVGIIIFMLIIAFAVWIKIFLLPLIMQAAKDEDYCLSVANKLIPGEDKPLKPTKEETQEFPGISMISSRFRVELQCEREHWYNHKTPPLK
jgi:hypothetical protein